MAEEQKVGSLYFCKFGIQLQYIYNIHSCKMKADTSEGCTLNYFMLSSLPW